jgi:chromosome segregation protein
LDRRTRELAELDQQHRRKREALSISEAALPALEQTHREATEAADQAGRELSSLDARHTALELLQRQVSRSGEMHAWLDNHQLDGYGRLWQGIRISGWEDALEPCASGASPSIGRLQRAASYSDQPRPDFLSSTNAPPSPAEQSLGVRRAQYITCTDPGMGAVLKD